MNSTGLPFKPVMAYRATRYARWTPSHADRAETAFALWTSFYIGVLTTIVLLFRILPMQDYADWVYQGSLFRSIVLNQNPLSGYYHLHPFVIPNVAVTVFIGILSVATGVEVAGKIVLVVSSLVLASGIVRYVSAHSTIDRLSALHLAAWCTLSLHFFMGYLHFQLGLGFAFHFAASIRRRDQLPDALTLALIFLAAYLVHFISLLLILSYLVELQIDRRNRTQLAKLALAVAPVCILTMAFMVGDHHSTIKSGTLVRSWYNYPLRLVVFESVLKPFVRFKGMDEPAAAFAVVNAASLIVILGIIAWALFRSWGAPRLRLNFLIVATMMPLVILVPDELGGLGYPAQRLVVWTFVNAVICAARSVGSVRFLRSCFLVCALCASVWGIVHAAILERAILHGVIPVPEAVRADDTRNGVNAFVRVTYYEAFEHPAAIPVFPTGMFTYNGVDSMDRKLTSVLTARTLDYLGRKR